MADLILFIFITTVHIAEQVMLLGFLVWILAERDCQKLNHTSLHRAIQTHPFIILIWAASWQNQQNGMCVQRRLRWAWVSIQSDQSWLSVSEESLGPKHSPSMIRVFAAFMTKALFLSYPLSAPRRLIRLGGCPGWSESSLHTQSFCWFCHDVAHLSVPNHETVKSSSSVASQVFLMMFFDQRSNPHFDNTLSWPWSMVV